MQKYWGERLTGIIIIGLSIYLGIVALDFPAKGGTFPLFSIGGMIFLSLILILNSFLGKRPEMEERMKFDLSYAKIKPLLLTIVVALYIPLIFELGYFTSTIIFFVAAAYLVGIRNYFTILLTGILLFPLMYAFFVWFLQANLPQGLLY